MPTSAKPLLSDSAKRQIEVTAANVAFPGQDPNKAYNTEENPVFKKEAVYDINTNLLQLDAVKGQLASNVKIYKTPSTPDDPTKAIENGLALISDDLGVSPEDIISQSDLCINGTTVGLNELIQHKGSLVGLICTKGHEDSIEIRLGHKEDGYRYDPDYPPAVMLAPRYLRRGIRERVISNGTIIYFQD